MIPLLNSGYREFSGWVSVCNLDQLLAGDLKIATKGELNTVTVDGRNPASLGNHGKPLLVGIHRGIIRNQGFSGGA